MPRKTKTWHGKIWLRKKACVENTYGGKDRVEKTGVKKTVRETTGGRKDRLENTGGKKPSIPTYIFKKKQV